MTIDRRTRRAPSCLDGRRRFLAALSGLGLGSGLFPGALWAKLQEADERRVSIDMIRDAAALAGLELSDEELEAMHGDVNDNLERIEELRQVSLDNADPLPLHFNPVVPGISVPDGESFFRPAAPSDVRRPDDLEEIAFSPLPRLAELVRTRPVRPSELTEMYLARLKRHDPTLLCVVTLTEDRAREEAARADAEIAEGDYRGPLHGIPYGVKDIIAAAGYPTTWGTPPLRDQVFDHDATVVERLGEAGAVLVAKLTTGELAFGDRWFGGRTRNPWNPEEGSSGSSAGSAAATAAGLVGFALGTDTGGSILSPALRCGVIGLRPTFGRVSRHGVMNAGFSLDKVGPMCRAVEGCAAVLQAIAGADDRDMAIIHEAPLRWDADLDVGDLRVGYYASGFERQEDPELRRLDAEALDTLRSLGFELVPLEFPASRLTYFIEYIERAAGFDEFARSGLDDGLLWRGHAADLDAYHLVPAVEYLQANRVRMQLMQEVAGIMADVDVVLGPRTSLDPRKGLNPLISMTGHPVAAVPSGFTAAGTPTGLEIVGHLFDEGRLLAFARALHEATGTHRRHPELGV